MKSSEATLVADVIGVGDGYVRVHDFLESSQGMAPLPITFSVVFADMRLQYLPLTLVPTLLLLLMTNKLETS